MKIVAAAACLIALGMSSAAFGGANVGHKIAVHVVPHGATCKSLPTFADCSQIETSYAGQGDIDVIPVFFGLNEYYVVEFALAWPAEWGTMDYLRCAGDLEVGSIVNPGDGMATAWIECQHTWSVAHGYGWLNATGPGTVGIVRNPPTGDYGVVDCAPVGTRAYDYPAATFSAGIGGVVGEDPCQAVYLPMSVAKTDGLGGHCASAGNTITYTIAYSSAGNSADVHNAVLTDSLPAGFGFVAANAGGTYDSTSHDVIWALGTIAEGQTGSVQVVGTADVEPGATLTNTCRITSDEAPAGEAATVTRVCNQTYLPLNLTKDDGITGTECVYNGYNLTYSIAYDNSTNTGAVHDVVLVDYLPALTTFVSATGGGVYNGAVRTVTWQIGTLLAAAGGQRVLTIGVNAPSGSSIANTCEITSDEAPMTQTIRHTSVCSAASPLTLTKSDGLGGQCACRGDTLTYTLSYQNTMDYAGVTGVTLVDNLPDGTEFVSASGEGVYDQFDRTVTWTIGGLAPREGGSQEIMAAVTASPGSVVTNTCQVTSNETPNSTASKVTSVCSTVYRPLGLAKTASVGSCVDYGDTITCAISYDNAANQIDVHNVVLTDFLPSQTDFVSASPGGVYDGGSMVTWALGTLAPGESGSQQVTIAVRVARGVAFTNQCSLTSSEAPPSDAGKTLRVCGGSGRNPTNKIAVHVKAHPTSCKAIPTFTNCGMMTTTYPDCGEIDAIPVFYDLVEFTVVEFGLQWPTEWGTCDFTRCQGTIAVGGIVESGDGIAIAWSQCQYTWSVAPGVGWLAVTSPGLIWPVPNPATGDVGVVNCAPSPGPYYDYPMAIAEGGVCGIRGSDPCRPTKLEPTTWGAIKAMFK